MGLFFSVCHVESFTLEVLAMLQHSWYVLSILMGMATGWNAQTRSDRALPWDLVIRKFWPHTLVGLVATIILWRYAGGGFNWFVPLLAGLNKGHMQADF